MTSEFPGGAVSFATPPAGIGQRTLEDSALIVIAGGAAVKYALSRHSPGWTRHLSRDEQLAIHESGHGAIAVALGRHLYQLSIEAPGITFGRVRILAFTYYGREPQATQPPSWTDVKTDSQTVVRLASELTPAPAGWREVRVTVRRLQRQCDELIAERWEQICMLADQLLRQGTLDQVQIEALLNPRPRREWTVC